MVEPSSGSGDDEFPDESFPPVEMSKGELSAIESPEIPGDVAMIDQTPWVKPSRRHPRTASDAVKVHDTTCVPLVAFTVISAPSCAPPTSTVRNPFWIAPRGDAVSGASGVDVSLPESSSVSGGGVLVLVVVEDELDVVVVPWGVVVFVGVSAAIVVVTTG